MRFGCCASERAREFLEAALVDATARGEAKREPIWRESLAVGSTVFVEKVRPQVIRKLDVREVSEVPAAEQLMSLENLKRLGQAVATGLARLRNERRSATANQDPTCVARAGDLEATLREVLTALPRQWKSVRIDPDKVKLATFKMLYDTGTAAQVFDAYVSAKEGDWGGLSLLSLSWDRKPPSGLSVGDSFCKLMSAGIYEPGRDYLQDMAPLDSILGSPSTRLSFGMVQLCPELRSAIRNTAARYQKHRRHSVPTLVVNGALDMSSPVEVARKELMPYLRKGKLVVLPNLGHNDPFTAQEAFVQLMEGFYSSGEAHTEKYLAAPVNFTPARRLTELAKEAVK